MKHKDNTKGFSEAFYKLPHYIMPQVKNEICEEIAKVNKSGKKWSKSTFNSKRNGHRNLTEAEWNIIIRILMRYRIKIYE